jgi:hypothetical protein
VSKPGLNHQNTYKMTFDFIYKNKSSKKINYVECMIALEQCLAFGSLSSKNEKTCQNRKSQKKSIIKK